MGDVAFWHSVVLIGLAVFGLLLYHGSVWRDLRKSPLRRPQTLQVAKGKALDRHALAWGLQRKRYWWIFRESDKKLRARILERIRGTAYVTPTHIVGVGGASPERWKRALK